MEKMTKKEMFAYIAKALSGDANVVEFCEKEIASLDKKSAKAREVAAAKRGAGDALEDAVYAVLTDELMTVAEIVEALNDETTSANKVVYRANSLVSKGLAEKADVKIDGVDGAKARVVKAFRKM